MNGNFSAYIFDLDGVIVDTARYHYLAWRKLANTLGFDLTVEQNERLKGVSRMRSLEIVLEIGNIRASEEQKLRYAEKKNADYVELISTMDEGEVLPGVREFLTEARRQDYKMALGSASKNAPFILKAVGVSGFFDAVIDGTKVSKAKPDPEVFLKAAEELGVNPERCVVFEDAVAGIEAAHRAGMFCVGIGSPAVLTEPDMVVPGFVGLTPDMISRIRTA